MTFGGRSADIVMGATACGSNVRACSSALVFRFGTPRHLGSRPILEAPTTRRTRRTEARRPRELTFNSYVDLLETSVTATVTRDPSTQLDDDFRDSLAHTRAFVRNVVVPREQEIDADDATLDSGDWWTRAACRGAELAVFFSPDDERGHARDRRETQARQICRPCPVLAQCRDHALVVGEPYGVWVA